MWKSLNWVRVCRYSNTYLFFCGYYPAKWKLDKAEADFKKNAKHAKRLQRAKDDYGEHRSHVAQRHSAPTLFSSFFFLILVRILGTEYGGKVMAILPFSPINLIYRITARGLDWSNVPPDALNGTDIEMKQAASYLTIYILAGMSVKFYVNKAFGTPAPVGADEGLLTMMESPAAKKMMGLDTEAE